jgi:aquaporin Z
MHQTFREHLPEYLMEAAGLGLFMVSAGVFATMLEYPDSLIHQAINDPLLRRILMGIAIGLTAIGIIYSPWGQQSGAHLNPALTLTFFSLRKIALWDAIFYIIAQFAGGLTGVLLVLLILGDRFAQPPVSYIATVPRPEGAMVAFIAETIISFGLMLLVLFTTNSRRFARYTGLFAGLLLAFYITVEAPFSGMSLNPARTFASALPSGLWTHVWVYFTAPIFGMFLASVAYRTVKRQDEVKCAKINHHTSRRCIFHCGYRGQTIQAGNSPQPYDISKS